MSPPTRPSEHIWSRSLTGGWPGPAASRPSSISATQKQAAEDAIAGLRGLRPGPAGRAVGGAGGAGEAGIGKTALLEWAAGGAPEMQVARVAGVLAEMGMGFAGLDQLLVPFLSGLGGLPGPQAQALGAAFGLVAGPPPDRFVVGLAALTLLADAAAARPVLCLVDDAQWVDQVSVEVLGFIARRLCAGRVGMVLTVRDGEGPLAALAGLPELVLGGLPEQAAGELRAAAAGAHVDERVGAQIVAGVAGNPLALVEAAAELSAGELSGAVPLGWPLRSGGRLEEWYLARVRALPAGTRTLLLVAAADPTGDPGLVYQAAAQLGAGAEAAGAAGAGRLVAWAPRVVFRHPLIRSAAYYTAPPGARRRAHAALAQATDPAADPDRRAWHRAEAADGPDEQVAAALEHSAGRTPFPAQPGELSFRVSTSREGGPVMSVYAGIDVHRKRSQVAVIDQSGEVLANRNVPNGAEPILGVIGGLPPGTPAAFEAGFGTTWLVELLEDYGFAPHLVHPSRCTAIASARLKNDKVDYSALTHCGIPAISQELAAGSSSPPRGAHGRPR
jgi:hypothetical protein